MTPAEHARRTSATEGGSRTRDRLVDRGAGVVGIGTVERHFLVGPELLPEWFRDEVPSGVRLLHTE